MAKLNELGSDFELPPEGKYPATLVQFIDLGSQAGKFGESRQADVVFEIDGLTTAEGRPMQAHKRVFNLSPRSKNFREMVRALTGLHSIAEVDTRDLLRKTCELTIEHVVTDDGSQFANVETKPLRAKKALAEPESPIVFFSLHPADFSAADLDGLSERRREKIRESSTYKELMAASSPKAKPAKGRGVGKAAPAEKPDPQDEIPF